MICKKCKAVNPESAKFCMNCGERFGCSNCGFINLTPSMKFCPACGARLLNSQQDNVRNINADNKNDGQNNVFNPSDFDKLCDLIVASLPRTYSIYYSSSYLANLLQYVKNHRNFKGINKDLIDFSKIKDQLDNHIETAICAKQKFFNNFINSNLMNGIDLDEGNYTISSYEIDSNKRDILSQVFEPMAAINHAISQILANIPLIIELVEKTDPGLGGLIKRGLQWCGGFGIGSAAVCMFPVAGPIALMLAGAVLSDDKPANNDQYMLNDLIRSNDESARVIEENYNIIMDKIINDQDKFLGRDIKLKLSEIFNDKVLNNKLTESQLRDYLELYTQNLSKRIDYTIQCDNEIKLFNQQSDNFFMSQDKYEDLKSMISSDNLSIMFDLINNRNLPIYEFIKNYQWWSFPSEDYYPIKLDSLLSFQKIIDRFTITDNSALLYTMCNSSLYVKGSGKEFNAKKLRNFEKAHGTCRSALLYLFYDYTFFGSGEEGFGLSNLEFFYNINSQKGRFAFKSISSVSLENGKMKIESIYASIPPLLIDLAYIDKKYHRRFVNIIDNMIKIQY